MSTGRVAITGAAGMLGSHLVDALLDAGREVVGVDDLSQGAMENLRPAAQAAGFRFVRGDILDGELLRAAFDGAEWVIHLAERKIPRYCSSLATLRVNCLGTESVLEAAARGGCRVLYGSTGEVYGKNAELPFSEESAVVLGRTWANRWSYACSKLYGEHLCFGYREEHKTPVTVLRLANLYGPRERRDWLGGAPSVFIESALSGQPLPVHEDGTQSRAFLHVRDAVRAIEAAMSSAAAEGEVVNVASDGRTSMIDLAYLVGRLCELPGKIPIEFIHYTEFSREYEDVRHREYSLTKARALLGFAPSVRLEEGLMETIAWHRSARAAEGAGPHGR